MNFQYLNPDHKLRIHHAPLATRFNRWKSYGKRQTTGPYEFRADADYYHAFCYLGSDFMPSLRHQWADEIINLKHAGWFCDELQYQTIRGIVFRLPKERGFLAGWSMGDGMVTEIDRSIYADEESAAYAADSMAESAAEAEREYQADNTEEE